MADTEHMKIINGIAPPQNIQLRRVDIPIRVSSEGTSLAELHQRWLESQTRSADLPEPVQQESPCGSSNNQR
jgi:hypothetical protein